MKNTQTEKYQSKGLQKFTDYESIKTRADIVNFYDCFPDETDSYGQWLSTRINEEQLIEDKNNAFIDRYYNRLEILTEISHPETIESFRRERWRLNQRKIENAIHNFICTNDRLPNNQEIRDSTGLSRVTIGKHLKEGTGSAMYKEDLEISRLLTIKAVTRLYKIGMKNNDVRALKVFLDYFCNQSTKTISNIREQNNYIQINNTRIDEMLVNNLPEDSILQIERIINEYQLKHHC